MQLEGISNYHSWARAMEMALRSKNKMTFVNGLVPVPDELDPRYYDWDRCNTMVLSWILRAVSPTIGRGVLWINTAEGVWKDLKKRFSQQDVFRIAEIQSQIYQTKQAFASVPSCQRDKFSPRAKRCIFLVFANGVKGYKLLDVQTREVFLSRDVSFYENIFPFENIHAKKHPDLILPFEGVSCLNIDEDTPLPTAENSSNLHEDSLVFPVQENEVENTDTIQPSEPRRSTRVRITPVYLNDYACQNAIRRTSPHDISKFMSYDSLSQTYRAFAANMNCCTLLDTGSGGWVSSVQQWQSRNPKVSLSFVDEVYFELLLKYKYDGVGPILILTMVAFIKLNGD
nr:uncharacterized protein LOC109166898 [Ipomoea batatas]